MLACTSTWDILAVTTGFMTHRVSTTGMGTVTAGIIMDITTNTFANTIANSMGSTTTGTIITPVIAPGAMDTGDTIATTTGIIAIPTGDPTMTATIAATEVRVPGPEGIKCNKICVRTRKGKQLTINR